MRLTLFGFTFTLLSFFAAVQVHAAGTKRNPNEFPEPKKSIRGFWFRNYYDHIPTPYVAGPLNADGTKLVELNGANSKWALLLKKNEELFSPAYKFYDDSFQPHESKIQNCFYHGEMQNAPGSFIAVSDCDGISGMIVNSTIRYSIHTLEKNEGVIIVKEISHGDKLGADYPTELPPEHEYHKPKPKPPQNDEIKSNAEALNEDPEAQGAPSDTEPVNTNTYLPTGYNSKACREIKRREKQILKKKLRIENINYADYGLALAQPCTPEQMQEYNNTVSSPRMKKRDTAASDSKYYDIAFTLIYMEDISEDAQAELYIADVANMLQQYYKHHDFDGRSARISGSHYLRSNKTLLEYTDLDQLPPSDQGRSYYRHWFEHATTKDFPDTHIKYLLSRPTTFLQLKAQGVARVNVLCHQPSASGVTFIQESSLTNAYNIVGITVHEIGHITGIKHTNECEVKEPFATTMDPTRIDHGEWTDFAKCSLAMKKCNPSSYR